MHTDDTKTLPDHALNEAVYLNGDGTELLVSDLGWTQEQVEEAHRRYLPFKEYWDAPEMDAYDAL